MLSLVRSGDDGIRQVDVYMNKTTGRMYAIAYFLYDTHTVYMPLLPLWNGEEILGSTPIYHHEEPHDIVQFPRHIEARDFLDDYDALMEERYDSVVYH